LDASSAVDLTSAKAKRSLDDSSEDNTTKEFLIKQLGSLAEGRRTCALGVSVAVNYEGRQLRGESAPVFFARPIQGNLGPAQQFGHALEFSVKFFAGFGCWGLIYRERASERNRNRKEQPRKGKAQTRWQRRGNTRHPTERKVHILLQLTSLVRRTRECHETVGG